jgi:hypothetical protein
MPRVPRGEKRPADVIGNAVHVMKVLSAAGLRPVQVKVPDTRRPGFAEECRRQSLIVAAADATDHELQGFLDAALADLNDDAAG